MILAAFCSSLFILFGLHLQMIVGLDDFKPQKFILYWNALFFFLRPSDHYCCCYIYCRAVLLLEWSICWIHCACICIASIHRNTYNYGRSMGDYGTSMMFYFFFSVLLLTLLFDTETTKTDALKPVFKLASGFHVKCPMFGHRIGCYAQIPSPHFCLSSSHFHFIFSCTIVLCVVFFVLFNLLAKPKMYNWQRVMIWWSTSQNRRITQKKNTNIENNKTKNNNSNNSKSVDSTHTKIAI